MKRSIYAFVGVVACLTATSAFAWDGTDNETGNSVEIEQGQLVRTGNDIDYLDNSEGEYKSGTVDSITRYGSTVDVDVTDNDSGETHTLEMEDR